ncbi:MAG TPA: heme ABC transporter ATP-binding protein [Bacteroidia bacterium]|nr:heme ABC transporter ATP-binding protein [Bacteroidia bacterium]
MLEVKNVSYKIGEHQILDNISALFEPGKLTMILGPNGSGKSTLLKIISNEINNYSGSVHYDKKLLNKKDTGSVSKIRAVLSQESELSFPLTVEEVVMMGRYPHFNLRPSKKDTEICHQALKRMKMDSFHERNYLTLSGGEKQRVHFARVMAQIWEQPEDKYRYLLLDEPIASLDLNYQHEFLKIAKEVAQQNTVTIVVIHDINLALQYADFVLLINKGKIVAMGNTLEVITVENIQEIYALRCRVVQDKTSHIPYFIVESSI